MNRIVIVGASAAGLTAAEALRRRGYDGRLTLIGDERHAPYDRPPLSKQVLAGTWEAGRTALRSPEALAGLGADIRLGRAATGLDITGRQVHIGDGHPIDFDGLVIATGLTPRRLPGGDLAGVHVLRTLDDAVALRAALLAGPRVVVVGTGFLGTEVAVTARTMGAEVTLAGPRPVLRPFGDRVGALVAALHRDHGTVLRCGVPVRRLRGAGGRATGVELADDTLLPADVVVLAIGSDPATGRLEGSGLRLGDGVTCDRFCRAAPGIYAAGDVASSPPTAVSPPPTPATARWSGSSAGTTRVRCTDCAGSSPNVPPGRPRNRPMPRRSQGTRSGGFGCPVRRRP
ncbi:hypothetical protein GCM10023191_024670 [Actinoallomurus oryzae]|uniref:FAD/NAD(P)-binding domain-containing protein n=1 Tax=Actinoallomurus oryzae TaxID=502180 RepID=A0ABP8PSL2_9ACTN